MTLIAAEEAAELWTDLAELRLNSRRVLAALDRGDLHETRLLAAESERLIGRVRPEIELRIASSEANEDDALVREVLGELDRMNRRILEVLAERRAEAETELDKSRAARLRLVHHRSDDSREPALIDRRG